MSDGGHLLAMSCSSNAGLGGILWSTSTGEISDSTTMCSSVYQPGWNLNKFNMNKKWVNAETYGKDVGNVIWGLRNNMHDNAEWIWTGPQNEKTNIYCRKIIK